MADARYGKRKRSEKLQYHLKRTDKMWISVDHIWIKKKEASPNPSEGRGVQIAKCRPKSSEPMVTDQREVKEGSADS